MPGSFSAGMPQKIKSSRSILSGTAVAKNHPRVEDIMKKLNPRIKLFLKIVIFVFPMVLLLFFIFLKITSPKIYWGIIQEDSFIENVQCIVYFASFIVAILISHKFLKGKRRLYALLYLVLSFGFLFISIEEISWGQRIFGISTPQYFQHHNWQREISLHNLDAVKPHFLHNAYILVGFYGSFAWLILWLILPNRIRAKNNSAMNFTVPGWYLTLYYLYFEYISNLLLSLHITDHFRAPPRFFVWRDQEPAELLLSFGFLLFVMINYYGRLSRTKVIPRPRGQGNPPLLP